eukprot:CAMPEP_0184305108 /NCGR_PEP_ID=MMETSP1049-20130417/14470_1 /TAXON_ID=77928 /ORGANISM="Proteomonas sulcata, Strain CCMP704" /LENGTH=268 /DNA_ID=CAMNT_0026617103 /DNA_START=154 /DNA_END=960 /DNA_ORIENTATION=+
MASFAPLRLDLHADPSIRTLWYSLVQGLCSQLKPEKGVDVLIEELLKSPEYDLDTVTPGVLPCDLPGDDREGVGMKPECKVIRVQQSFFRVVSRFAEWVYDKCSSVQGLNSLKFGARLGKYDQQFQASDRERMKSFRRFQGESDIEQLRAESEHFREILKWIVNHVNQECDVPQRLIPTVIDKFLSPPLNFDYHKDTGVKENPDGKEFLYTAVLKCTNGAAAVDFLNGPFKAYEDEPSLMIFNSECYHRSMKPNHKCVKVACFFEMSV